MKILYLAHRIPYPPNKGDKIRTFNEIKYLSKDHEIHLLALADNPDDLKYQDHLKSYCQKVKIIRLNTKAAKIRSMLALLHATPLSVRYFYSAAFQKILDKWLDSDRYDAVFCFSSPMAEYLFRSLETNRLLQDRPGVKKADSPVFIMDFCDVDSRKWDQYAQRTRFPLKMIYRIEHNRLFAYEKYINQIFDHSVFVSEAEADLFRTLYPQARSLAAIPNGVDREFFSPQAGFAPVELRDKKGQQALVFTGAMDYYANIDGVIWFCRTVFPLIKKEFPDTLFYIVGSKPSPAVRALESVSGVKVTGFVEDIRPYYRYADVCVIPLRIAAGVQNKVLEAMAMGKPVVTTSNAFKGILGQPAEHAFVEDRADRFADAVKELLKDKQKADALGKRGKHFVAGTYNWETGMSKLEKLIRSPLAN